MHFEGGLHGSASSALLKNIGLAHVNLIQNKLLSQDTALPSRPFDDVLGTLEHINWPTSPRYPLLCVDVRVEHCLTMNTAAVILHTCAEVFMSLLSGSCKPKITLRSDIVCHCVCAWGSVCNLHCSWKVWSTDRFVATWGEFLQRPDAVHDSQYATIKEMYTVATGAGAKKGGKKKKA